MSSKPRLAFVLDALPGIGGGEKTFFAALEVFPQADIFTLIYNRKAFAKSPISGREIYTSPLDRFPFARSRYRLLLPFMPSAVERFDLRRYDLVIAFSYAVAHGVHVHPGTRLLSYTHTPMRYAWSDINLDGTRSRRNPLVSLAMQTFREWDRVAARHVDEFAAVSSMIAARIQSAYQREARVIYPPVETERFSPKDCRGNYFVTLSRLVPHKRLDVVIEAFSCLKLPLKVIGDGPQRKKLQRHAASNIEFLGYQTEESVARLLSEARGFVCAAEEDFGIAMVEAQAAGCPVIAYRGGGALETVLEGETGLFFGEQSAASVIEAVERFERSAHCFYGEVMAENAQRFSKARFLREFMRFVEQSL